MTVVLEAHTGGGSTHRLTVGDVVVLERSPTTSALRMTLAIPANVVARQHAEAMHAYVSDDGTEVRFPPRWQVAEVMSW